MRAGYPDIFASPGFVHGWKRWRSQLSVFRSHVFCTHYNTLAGPFSCKFGNALVYGVRPGPAGPGAASAPIPDAPFGKTESPHPAPALRSKASSFWPNVMNVTA
jgi:hypothetical protein